MTDPALDGRRAGPLHSLGRRVYLTYRYRCPKQLAWRAATFPLRFTPLKPYLRLEARSRHDLLAVRRWYRRHGRPVTLVIPSYRDITHVRRLVRAIRRTTPRRAVRIVVADDASGP